MAFRPAKNPNKVTPYRIRRFDGIGGEERGVITATDENGYDISSGRFNEFQDLDCAIAGLARLRPGKRKVSDTGHTADITAMIFSTLGGKQRYGYVVDGSLTFVDIPTYYTPGGDPVELTPTVPPNYYIWDQIRREYRSVADAPRVTSEYPVADPSEFSI